jgi:hypothetical protein
VIIRTKVAALKIEGYRSIRSLELTGLNETVVLHGRNGSGKSNIVRALRLSLRAFDFRWTRNQNIGDTQASRLWLSWEDAEEHLGFRREDVHRPQAARVRIRTSICLNQRTASPPFDLPPGEEETYLNLVVVLEPGENGVHLFIEHAQWMVPEGNGVGLRPLANVGAPVASFDQARNEAFRVFEMAFLRNTLPRLVSWTDAYRLPAGELSGRSPYDIEDQVYLQLTSPSPTASATQDRLQELLGRVALFGVDQPTHIRPVTVTQGDSSPMMRGDAAAGWSTQGSSRSAGPVRRGRVHVRHPAAGDLPLTSLGSGEQQVFLMLAQRVLEDIPIVVIEEPEAHLHVDLMRRFSDVLQTAVLPTASGAPAISQLWLATHHHAFAIAPEYLDVEFRNGQTLATRKNRAQAAVHFYEPGPMWDALRSLLASGLKRDEVIFRHDGRAVTAGEIEESERTDRKLFSAWVVSVTSMAVLAMKAKANAT